MKDIKLKSLSTINYNLSEIFYGIIKDVYRDDFNLFYNVKCILTIPKVILFIMSKNLKYNIVSSSYLFVLYFKYGILLIY